MLVVPAAMIRERDAFKVDPRRERQRRRARQVLPRLGEIAFAAPPGRPAPVRDGVELLRLGREPSAFPDGRDPSVLDNRLIAAALEFRWKHPGLRVVVLSGDTTVRLPAREYGPDQMTIPEHLECGVSTDVPPPTP